MQPLVGYCLAAEDLHRAAQGYSLPSLLGISNEGFDNQNADLILRQKDEILNARKNM